MPMVFDGLSPPPSPKQVQATLPVQLIGRKMYPFNLLAGLSYQSSLQVERSIPSPSPPQLDLGYPASLVSIERCMPFNLLAGLPCQSSLQVERCILSVYWLGYPASIVSRQKDVSFQSIGWAILPVYPASIIGRKMYPFNLLAGLSCQSSIQVERCILSIYWLGYPASLVYRQKDVSFQSIISIQEVSTKPRRRKTALNNLSVYPPNRAGLLHKFYISFYFACNRPRWIQIKLCKKTQASMSMMKSTTKCRPASHTWALWRGTRPRQTGRYGLSLMICDEAPQKVIYKLFKLFSEV